MSVSDAWLSTTGAHHPNHQNPQGLPRPSYERAFWNRLSEPSILLSIIILFFSALCGANILSAPSALGSRLWSLLVTAVPSFLVFAIDDWLSPFPLPRQPLNRLTPAAARQAKSNALARILGKGPGGRGVLSSVSYAGKTSFSRLMAKGSIDQPAGLGNLSNSCYQNSILQSLSALAPLRDYLAWIAEEEEAGGLPLVRTARTLGRLVRDLHGPALNGETLWTPPDLKRMSTFQQQDAQEYFCKLLNEVQEEVEKALKAVQTFPGFETGLSDSGVVLPAYRDMLRQVQPIWEVPADRSGSDSDDSDDAQAIYSPRSNDSGYHSNASSTFSARRAASVNNCFRIPLEGLVAQRIVCQACGYSSGLSMNPFYCLTLNLGAGVHEQRLEDTLNSFSAVENIEGVQCGSCTLIKFCDRLRVIISRFEADSGEGPEETRRKQPVPYERLEAAEAALFDDNFEEKTIAERCKIPSKQRVESTKSRQVGIARAPPSIAFHINRSRFDETTGYTYKNPAAVRFPLRLDLGPWCLGSVAFRASASGSSRARTQDTGSTRGEEVPPKSDLNGDDQEEQWELPGQLPMVSGTENSSKITGPLYELRAVITHYGQHENGHYVCYRKHPHLPRPPPDDDKLKENAPAMRETDDCPPNLASEQNHCEEDGSEHGSQEATAQLGPNPDAASDHSASIADAEDTKVEEEAVPQWWRLSDQNVSPSDEETVLAQGGVFMLFYDRVDATSVFRSADAPRSSTAGSDTGRASSSVSERSGTPSSDNTSVEDSENLTNSVSSVLLLDECKSEGDPLADGDDAHEAVAVHGSTDSTPVDTDGEAFAVKHRNDR